MIIGIDASRALGGQVTGTERYSREIIRHLLLLPNAGEQRWRLYVPQPPAPDCFPDLPGVEICVLPARRLWTHRALAAEIVRRPPDVLFVPAHVIPLLPPPLLPPSVVTLHDVGYRYFPEAHTRAQRLYLDLSTRWSARVARRIIAPSRFTATDLARFYGVAAAKIRVIHEAAEAGRKTEDEGRSEKSAIHHSPFTIYHSSYALYLGTIQPRKNLARLIEAYGKVVAQHGVKWDLVLAGKRGWLSDELYAAAARHGVAERVHFSGYVPDADVEALWNNALFFAFPSLFEGFGLPVLEAQQRGVPVMCANNSALPEVAGNAALLVDPRDVDALADAMLRLSQDEALRQKLIAAGYENVKRFSWEKAARETLAVLEKAKDEA